MRYRKMHATTLGIDLNAAEQVVHPDRALGEVASTSETRALRGERNSDDGFLRAGGDMVKLNESAGTEDNFGDNKHDDHRGDGIVGEATEMKVECAESFEDKGAGISDTAVNDLTGNQFFEINSARGIGNNEITCSFDFSSRVFRYGEGEGNGIHLMVDLNEFCRDKKKDVILALNADSSKEIIGQKARLEARSVSVFGAYDLVWGKVRSYPWWPGQIFDPSAASTMAEKYSKKDRLLIAYFGDQTFAWNEAMNIKPFEEHFSKMEKQSDSPSFCYALDCALEELSRRVEYGLACHCLPKEIYDKMPTQIVINAGIKGESFSRDLKDRYSRAGSFNPVKFIEYIKRIGESPLSGCDRLELVVKRSCLLAFSRWRGYYNLPEFKVIDGLLDDGVDNYIESSKGLVLGKMMGSMLSHGSSIDYADPAAAGFDRRGKIGVSGKSRYVSGVQLSKKEKNLSDLMAHKQFVSRKKRKVQDPVSDDLATRGRRQLKPNQIFKVGHKFGKMDCEGSPTASCISQQHDEFSGILKTMAEKNSPEQMMAQLHSVARGTTDNALTPFISLFWEFRDFVVSNQGPNETAKWLNCFVTGETLDTRDSYWTDRFIQKGEQTDTEEGIAVENVKHGMIDTKSDEDGGSPTALILKFSNLSSIPSEENLNKIFNRFGPLHWSKTRIFKKTKRARVVFKRRVDAETAFSSSGKYSIFGPSLISYSLKYE
ncbi:hypothetical protein SAY86_030502 [Trapa natans]|uniref:PWWP domain-containing protein n=1 Tax=Trapa natans TaxID=22666 RepID=A0AAN7M317_TRANT|nr:hypothetical protein SAY86_030502 [Trapa natans]